MSFKGICINRFIDLISDLMVESLEKKIKQNEERDTILDKKCDMLKNSIQKWEECLQKNSNLSTLVEIENVPDSKQISVSVSFNDIFTHC